jgi:prolyl-tRNA editing enzyme YbaK/EbsC (Cys-tRNA(Pro) deacylase)
MKDYHPTVAKIREILDAAGIAYKTFEHEPVRTSEEAAKLRPEYVLHQGAKALVVKTKPKGFVMLVVPGDCRFNESKVKQALGIKEIRFATEAEVGEITGGIQIGGVPPFGNLFNLPVYVDVQVLANEEIIFNAGDRAFSIALKSADWQKVVGSVAVDIV